MRKLFIVFFIFVSLLALLLPFIAKKQLYASAFPEIAGIPPVPEISSYRSLPNFAGYDNVREKKEQFFGYLLPIIEAENLKILHKRAQIFNLAEASEQGELSAQQRSQFQQLKDRYDVDEQLSDEQAFEVLKRRVDIVPEMMVLVQAANESGWGTSRFARQGLNLFGQWCYQEGCGMVPGQRGADKKHEVKVFKTVNQAVRSYLHNINTHSAYQDLRMIRAQKRRSGEQLRATQLVEGLGSYSERGDEYIEELQAMIRVNRPVVEEVKNDTQQAANY
ncbi:glucosaminidase domain-containing protein [Idiomarina seosinensis]|uniref:glucosaminidase domain-containing protein n=1 Tax=Idiomarina seosinensis TaxID=281739 RepID=UPI00384AD140